MIGARTCLSLSLGTVLAALLSSCGDPVAVKSFAGPAQGSSYSVKYVDSLGAPDTAELKAAVEAILAEVDQQMSGYRDDSLVEQFNRAAAGSCMAMPQSVLKLVAVAQQLQHNSAGAFDLTLRPLLDLWGFGPASNGEQHRPSAAALEQVRSRVGQQYLHVKGQQLCKERDLQLDLNSLAAGYTVDLIVERLAELGLGSYLVEVTGELKAVGRKPDGLPWRIALEVPQDEQRVPQRVIALDGYGISTSGDYRNYFEEQGVRYSHTLDPVSAAPIRHKLAAVTVAAPSVLMADGLSTVLMVLGPDKGYEYARREGIAAFFISRAEKGFVTRSTPAFERLFPSGVEL